MKPIALAPACLAFVIAAAGAAEPPLLCDPAAYVPGVDAQGRPVPPADTSPPITVQIEDFVVAEVRTPRNRRLNEAEVGIVLDGLSQNAAPPCPPPPPPPPPPPR